jgi:hypothetical protein
MTLYLFSFAGGHFSEDVHSRRQKVLVEKHKDDDYNRSDRANHFNPHHSLCHQNYIAVASFDFFQRN